MRPSLTRELARMGTAILTRELDAGTVILTRELRFETPPADLAPDAAIPVTIATSFPVMRYGVVEMLDCSPEGVDLTRAPLSLIVGHDSARLAIGVVEDLQASGDKVTGQARFGSAPEAQQVRADVLAGIHPYVSVGYALLDEGTAIEGGLKFRWQPHEVSIVSVPADPAAGFFRSLSQGVQSMPNRQAASTQTRELDIVELCDRHNVAHMAARLIRSGQTVDQARAAILEEAIALDRAAGGHLNVSRAGGGGQVAAAERDRIVNTLVSRMGGRVDGEVISSTDCVGLAVRSLQLMGLRVADHESRDAILQRALNTRGAMHTTSDFSSLLGTAVGRVLHQAYEEAPAALKTIARLANLPDFREKSTVRLGAASSLEKVNEHGEFKYGTVEDAANTWRLFTYGRIIGITRQALINDDLGGFSSLLTKFGQSAARREADELVTILTNPPSVDNADLFSVVRNSLIVDVLGAAGIGAAVKSLRGQTDLDGSLITQEPATLVVPAALEMTARQLVATINPAQASNVQPYKLGVAVEPRLDAISTTAWYLVAGGQSALEYGYLEGAQGVQTFQQEGFEMDGLQIKARLDFGCGWVAPVGWVKSTGAGA